jgi:serine/threonine protein kinase
MPQSAPFATGLILNERYRIVKLLGQGGFGAVYRAWDLNLQTPCALKENFNPSPESARQFHREAMILANLRHVNLPTVIDHFSTPGQTQCLVMEFVEGQDMQQMIDQAGGSLPVNQVLQIVGQVCNALIYLHSQSPAVIHRDIKPANIKITSQKQVKLVDFGIAKVYDPTSRTTLGARAVTPGFSPPEQYGRGTTDARTDIYALGATLYIALTGQPPLESITRQMGSSMAAPRTIKPAIPPYIENAILKAMAISPAQRYQSVTELMGALGLSAPSGPAAAIPLSEAAIIAESFPPTVVYPHNAPPLQQHSGAYQSAAADYNGGLYGTLQAPYPSGAVPSEPSIAVAPPARRKPWLLIGIAGVIVALICAVTGYWAFLQLPTESEATETEWSEATRGATSDAGNGATAIVPPVTLTPLPSLIPTVIPPTLTAAFTPTVPPTLLPSNTPTRPPTLSPTVEGLWQACPDIYLSRLHVGDSAYVSYDPPLANIVRNNPRKSASEVGRINPGEEVDILDGPQCANNMVWWLVRSKKTGLTGWTSEGDMENYWLVPLP